MRPTLTPKQHGFSQTQITQDTQRPLSPRQRAKELAKFMPLILNEDNDQVAWLCYETLIENGSVLVFCESKKWCKQCCKMISNCLKQYSLNNSNQMNNNNNNNNNYNNNNNNNNGNSNNNIQRPSIKPNPKLKRLRQLTVSDLNELPCNSGSSGANSSNNMNSNNNNSNYKTCSVLQESILNGVAYHHAGLTMDEREIIEKAYRRGIISVLVATSTLAAGVNIPARRVIFRSARVGNQMLTSSKYKQMSGRAGRKGIDTFGESIIIGKNDNKRLIFDLIQSPLNNVNSQLLNDNQLTKYILEGIGNQFIKNRQQCTKYVNCTFLHTINHRKGSNNNSNDEDDFKMNSHDIDNNININGNNNKKLINIEKEIDNAIDYLFLHQFIEQRENVTNKNKNENKNKNDIIYHCTALGEATMGSSLSPDQALIIFNLFNNAREKGIYFNENLHLCYLLSPVRGCNHYNLEPNWDLYHKLFQMLSNKEKEIAIKEIGINEQFLVRMAFDRNKRYQLINNHNNNQQRNYGNSNNNCFDLSMYSRFWRAMILNCIVREQSLSYLINSNKFGNNIEIGSLQNLQTSASTFAGNCAIFCQRLNWNCLALLILHFAERISLGVESEILPLLEISCLKPYTARNLYNLGFKTVESLNDSSIEQIMLALIKSNQKYNKYNQNNIGNNKNNNNNGSYNQQQATMLKLAHNIKREANKVIIDQMNKEIQAQSQFDDENDNDVEDFAL